MGSSEKFCLRWNDFESNISKAFREIREDKDFFDITLACEDDQIPAHKVILSACSPFFRAILKRNKHEHPLLYLKGVKYSDLVSVLNFMYHGEVNVAQEDLNTFLAVAEDLKVKGLTQSDSSNNTSAPAVKSKSREPPESSIPPPSKKIRPNPTTSTPLPAVYKDDDIQEVTPVKTEPQLSTDNNVMAPVDHYGGGELVDADYGEDYGDYEGGYEGNYDGTIGDQNSSTADGNKDVSGYMTPVLDDTSCKDTWRCLICTRVIKRKYRMKDHIESRHFIGTPCHPCSRCGKLYSTKNSLEKHISTYHKEAFVDGKWNF
ncbi:broad-complex core protein isoforms 1/2/3/4/5 isoform X3 [Eurytemora carolleeae]|uniref:broad-complex core protein isoforms 1/2/3/4/5 isoform X3 n=1 Tax=Eurytemora carolleeae TaxID=1294199 RepID=UPI000C78BB1E|nr:broad-complex core protein isoforms 1/2/3/4/5 isoform X3 [Eurytemora carolleeae]|eukprot:XP_023319823.1 broad-complex core protein isoforms 1/2/3/4/5-like isoform X3 [Eurytemora affinis]